MLIPYEVLITFTMTLMAIPTILFLVAFVLLREQQPDLSRDFAIPGPTWVQVRLSSLVQRSPYVLYGGLVIHVEGCQMNAGAGGTPSRRAHDLPVRAGDRRQRPRGDAAVPGGVRVFSDCWGRGLGAYGVVDERKIPPCIQGAAGMAGASGEWGR